MSFQQLKRMSAVMGLVKKFNRPPRKRARVILRRWLARPIAALKGQTSYHYIRVFWTREVVWTTYLFKHMVRAMIRPIKRHRGYAELAKTMIKVEKL